MNAITHDGRAVVIDVEWQEGAYTRGHIREPMAYRHERISLWCQTILVPCVIKVQRGWTKEQLPTYDFVRVEAEVFTDGSAVVRWPMAHAGTHLTVDMKHGRCSTVELEGLEPEPVHVEHHSVIAAPVRSTSETRRRKQQIVGQLTLLEGME